MFGVRLSKMGSASKLGLIAKAIGILRKYGADAHVYLPGVGTISGITAGNYLDSAGTTAATVDNPVGLSLDALQAMTLGPERVTNGDFSSGVGWTQGAGWSIGGGVASAVAASGVLIQTTGVAVGKPHLLTISNPNGAAFQIRLGGASLGYTAATSISIIVHSAAGTLLEIVPNGPATCSIDNISVREIPGIHASQATTANKCLLRLTGGKYNWVFDTTDLLTATFPAGNESVTVIDSFSTGQVTNTGVNVVGAYSMGPSVTLYGRMIIKGSISASDLLVLQRFANSWAGL